MSFQMHVFPMTSAVVLHLLCTIVATIVTAPFYGNPPYFPIEISRCAASGSIPLSIFRVGSFSLLATIVFSDKGSGAPSSTLLWIGMVLIASFRDEDSLTLHLLGIAIVFWAASTSVPVNVLITSTFFFIARTPLKMLAVVISQSHHGLAIPRLSDLLSATQTILYQGSADPALLNTFRISALMQWAAFFNLLLHVK